MRHVYQMDHGTELLQDGTVRFRIWAPSERNMRISLDAGEPQPMRREQGDWFGAELPALPGTHYSFVMPDGLRVPDPTSRRQQGGVHGPSVVVDPLEYDWKTENWQGRPWTDAVIYELHVGAMGGYAGVTARLAFLAGIGITAIELMPLSEFPGRHNWGYDGVLPYAPESAYGSPDELKHMIDTAHALGIMVFLDVVYNHFGPDGAYIHLYAKSFFSEDFHTPWGAGIDFRRTVVQDYFIHNALYWLCEYRFDGLRFDALGAIQPQEFLTLLAARIRNGVEPGRYVHLAMEHEFNAARLLRGSFDAQWTDDYHHAMHVLLTGETSGYYADFVDATTLLARTLADGFAYQGQVSPHSGKPRGEPSGDLPTSSFIMFLQNHDQIGNRARGDRLAGSVHPRCLRAARSFLLLSPFIPLMFMGEEWGSRTPFLFFTDHHADLAELVRHGRRTEFGALGGFGADGGDLPDPNSPAVFAASRPDFDEADQPGYRDELALTRHLLALRRDRIAPRIRNAHGSGVTILAPGALLGRWRLDDGSTLQLACNTGTTPVALDPAGLPLLYGGEDGAGQAAQGGSLPGYSTVAWLGMPAAASTSSGIAAA